MCVTSVTCEVRVCGYVKNKAGLTGQTFPGRRILGHWPYPAPEELAETEPGTQDAVDVPFFYPPSRHVLAKHAGMATSALACRGFGLPALLLGLAAAVARPSASLARSLRLLSKEPCHGRTQSPAQ